MVDELTSHKLKCKIQAFLIVQMSVLFGVWIKSVYCDYILLDFSVKGMWHQLFQTLYKYVNRWYSPFFTLLVHLSNLIQRQLIFLWDLKNTNYRHFVKRITKLSIHPFSLKSLMSSFPFSFPFSFSRCSRCLHLFFFYTHQLPMLSILTLPPRWQGPRPPWNRNMEYNTSY